MRRLAFLFLLISSIAHGAVCIKGPYTSTVPEISTAAISSDGTTLTLGFSEPVTQGSAYANSQLNLDCSTGGDNITITYNVASATDGTASHTYDIAKTIYLGETCNLDFTGATNSLENFVGYDLGAITDFSVTNGSAQIQTSPCTELSQSAGGSYTGGSGLFTSGYTFAQSFKAPAAGSSVTIILNLLGLNDVPTTVEVRLDDDVDLSADTLGSATNEVSTQGSNCFLISSSTPLVSENTYWFAIQVNENWGYRINNLQYSSANPLADVTMYRRLGDYWDFTGYTYGTTNDLTFTVNVGTGCSCE